MADSPGDRILVTGALGQIGSDLVSRLREVYGQNSVIATDVQDQGDFPAPFLHLDVLDRDSLRQIISHYSIRTIYNLAAILSAHGEKDPDLCERVNLGGLQNVLDASREYGCRVFSPSSIAVFGPDSRPIARQASSLNPTTIYGVTKKKGEEMMLRYWENYGVNARGIRYPGLLSWKTVPTGGTTDYAVEVFNEIQAKGEYTFYVREDTRLPMMMMEDAIRATLMLMEAPSQGLSRWRAGYNVRGLTFSAIELATMIIAKKPGVEMRYIPDDRQKIADSWPEDLDDSPAKQEWGWKSAYDLEKMVDVMLAGFA